MSDNAAQAPRPQGPGENQHGQALQRQDSPAQEVSVPAVHFLLYEEYSVYRREFLGRAETVAEAQAQALVYSRRGRQSVVVRRKDAGNITSAFVLAYRAGRRVYPETPVTGTSAPTGTTGAKG